MSLVAAGASSGDLPDFVAALLVYTPQVRDRPRQEALTMRFLEPAIPQLDALFRKLRADADPMLRETLPPKAGKPYPLGQCLPITQAVLARLETFDGAGLSEAEAAGWAALSAFRTAGGRIDRAWGDLRGQYFQNAMVAGSLYVDVSNDTVVVTKPPVEILPFDEAGLSPITDYGHFARIAGRYWKRRLFPNHVLPQLAPWLPLVELGSSGRIRLGSFYSHMLGLTLAEGFAPSARVLAGPSMPPGLFAGVRGALAGGDLAVAADAEAGRAAALSACAAFRARGLAGDADTCARVLAAGRTANEALARLMALPQGAANPASAPEG